MISTKPFYILYACTLLSATPLNKLAGVLCIFTEFTYVFFTGIHSHTQRLMNEKENVSPDFRSPEVGTSGNKLSLLCIKIIVGYKV